MATTAHRPSIDISLLDGARRLVRETATLFTMFGWALDATHEAERLYHMSDRELASEGLTPETIPAAIRARLDGRR